MGGLGVISELRRRRVFGAVALYVVAAWVVLQVAELALSGLAIPETAIRYVWIGAFFGFPLAVFFSWRYNITAQGILRTRPAESGSAPDLALQKSDYVILTALLAVAAVVTFQLVGEIREVEVTDSSLSLEIQPNSIAVLPFDNLTGDKEQEYFVAGMHDALITSLSKITALRVTSRTSAVRVDKDLLMPNIGAMLGVARLVEGSVTREGDRIRIIVQLIDAATDQHLWAESYERRFTGILSLQSEMARSIADAIEIRLTPDEERRLSVNRTVSPETYEAYLKGMFQMHKETPRSYRRGIEILTEAVENDPTSALAYAGLAYGYSKLGHSPFPEDAYPKARDAALKALELDDTLAEAHLAVAMYKLYYEWNWEAAERGFERALELNPSLVLANYHYAWMLELLNRKDEALVYGQRTKVLSPLSPFMTGWLADQYRSSGLYERAIEEANYTFELSENYPVAWLVLGATYAEMGKFDEAIAAHEHLRDSYFWSFALGSTYAMAGYTENAQAILNTIEAKPENSVPLVLINAAMGNVEETFRWLDAARSIRVPWYPWLVAWFPHTAAMKNDPRMQELAQRLKLQVPPIST